MPDADTSIRLAAFRWLEEQALRRGEVLARTLLIRGFEFNGDRVPLMSAQQGIFKPRIMRRPLSLTTTANSPYNDTVGADGLLHYRYRGTDPMHRDNVGVREAMRRKEPLVYLHGVVPGRYLPFYPVFVVDADPATLTFRVQVDDLTRVTEALSTAAAMPGVAEGSDPVRAYRTVAAQARIHQHTFRARVLRAYREQCALCRLRHDELLDAAHIIPDSAPTGEPVVRNGLALCKLHHAAFDRMFLAVRPDYTVEVRRDILEEEDGPMLRHGLKGVHGQRIVLPRRAEWQPDQNRLEQRYEAFRSAQTR